MVEIISAGFGGQGVLTAGLILAKIAINNGKNVTWIPSYGSEMRGGTANCNVKIDDQEIASPFVKNIDVLIAMNAPSVEKFENMIKPDGLLIVNSSMVKGKKYRDDIRIVKVPANDIAREVNNPKGLNITVLGAFAKATGIFDKDSFIEGIDGFFASKGIVNPANRLCFEKGYDLLDN
ncbi:2-oxoacid:acceptor oxidoreductase family protein [Schnuerera ultunensis]|uniref:2-oxoacid:acceptor oxidoreductase, gamma subunit, pyruvate/2-ketoisovalerate family n=1 Tax=[Clostridium] ultunense Esp TaxID=1288971 RepID=A0A1M4PQE2_9FIRM|nr:2-oxoacid:acceptor oxidoreductase family protein [Schnuerera ultunensis]SHD77667.1 2-oxoacid:acceptor oxidoreductase, gamma subunit, pyruvate/2-ketoisovalerate family [[Clostridium] ultunense Esp]